MTKLWSHLLIITHALSMTWQAADVAFLHEPTSFGQGPGPGAGAWDRVQGPWAGAEGIVEKYYAKQNKI